ncbi:unnamed protein product [Polarella glacialis]|uniref:Calpain catalytic domain-containing protein n=1 Tax=Polarella glacialis TaxID=89957 RepID=A0A813J637_POLGL|nr:unnamed protein product [Polarella glacialis]
MSLAWRTLDGVFFDQSQPFKSGPIGTGAAKQIVEQKQKSDKLIGFASNEGSPDYVWVVAAGTRTGKQAGWTTQVYAVAELSDSNLFNDGWSGSDSVLPNNMQAAKWGRPGRGEGIGDDVEHISFMMSIDPNDIRQGDLGDCWLLSTLALCAEWPQFLPSLVDSTSLSVEGKYVVTLYDYGSQQSSQVTVDDSIPMSSGESPAFVNLTATGETWPTIFEKAFARLAGGYQNINGGVSTFAMGMLTGCTDLLTLQKQKDDSWQCWSNVFKSSNPQSSDNQEIKSCPWPDGTPGDKGKSIQEVLKFLEQWDAQNYLMCAGSDGGTNAEKSPDGIILGHAYSILQVKTEVAGTDVSLLQMRNPWGKSDFHGDWCDSSSLWDEHPDVAEAVGHEPSTTGEFWIDAIDVCSNYSSLFVCKKNMGPNHSKTFNEQQVDSSCAEAGVEPPSIKPGSQPASPGWLCSRGASVPFCGGSPDGCNIH